MYAHVIRYDERERAIKGQGENPIVSPCYNTRFNMYAHDNDATRTSRRATARRLAVRATGCWPAHRPDIDRIRIQGGGHYLCVPGAAPVVPSSARRTRPARARTHARTHATHANGAHGAGPRAITTRRGRENARGATGEEENQKKNPKKITRPAMYYNNIKFGCGLENIYM